VLNANAAELPMELAERGLPMLVNGSWASGARAAAIRESKLVTVALPGPLRVSLLPGLADGLLLGWRYRATLEDSSHEQPGQDSWKISPHYSIT
jgi:hypothetical protein